MNNWEYNENKQVGTDYSNTLNVESYDSHMQKVRNYEEEAKKIIQYLKVDKNSRIIEIGTGTGHFAISASKYVNEVYALDISKNMINYAKQKAQNNNISNIKWLNIGFIRLNEENKFDGAITKGALHHLPDFWKFVALKNIYKSTL